MNLKLLSFKKRKIELSITTMLWTRSARRLKESLMVLSRRKGLESRTKRKSLLISIGNAMRCMQPSKERKRPGRSALATSMICSLRAPTWQTLSSRTSKVKLQQRLITSWTTWRVRWAIVSLTKTSSSVTWASSSHASSRLSRSSARTFEQQPAFN